MCFSVNVRRHLLKRSSVGRHFLPRFSGILPRFLGILPRFSGILREFSSNQNFWGCACTPCTPTSYTTGIGRVRLSIMEQYVHLDTWRTSGYQFFCEDAVEPTGFYLVGRCRPSNGGHDCVGRNMDPDLCSRQTCPKGTDYRVDQCTYNNPVLFKQQKHKWLPYEHPRRKFDSALKNNFWFSCLLVLMK